jgi:hypothetical protein
MSHQSTPFRSPFDEANGSYGSIARLTGKAAVG